jgi:predicted dehydrogenase/threonine dehydrogenase-like Zn-dependent dehydrogenase
LKQILIRSGHAIVADVPCPSIESNEILVQVKVSCLSIGTEMSGVRLSSVPMWKRALKQPENVSKIIQLATTQGIGNAIGAVLEKKNATNPTGYSSAGIVIEVGNDIKDIKVGDFIACAGSPHAEIIKVSRNLCVPIPEGLDFESASTVTLGAIALQGVRRANPTLGETFVVIGLGVLGQLSVQLLRANGCKTIGVDIDRSRINLAEKSGLDIGVHPDASNEIEQVIRLTGGFGADGVIITAASASDELISTAFKMCRKKGRVVLVGDVGLNLNRSDFYSKELDFFISTSYGPGRYDNKYEEQGLDYPLSYVRWTENRNMQEYLYLLSKKQVQIESMVSATYPVLNSPEAYALLNEDKGKHLMVLITYPGIPEKNENLKLVKSKSQNIIENRLIRVAIIGAGGFARGVHLPILKSLKDRFKIQAIVTRTGHSSKSIAEQFGAVYASTNYKEVLLDPEIDAVIIATRHDLHGSMALEALKHGKHVLLEKPTCLKQTEFDDLDHFICNSTLEQLPVLLTGYNRRFSPFAVKMQNMLHNKTAPIIINYRMNAGFIPHDHWVHSSQGGGRNLGEACHIYDLFTFLTNSECIDVAVSSIRSENSQYSYSDNFVTTLRFKDGSVASLTYTSLGSKDYIKESADLFSDGKISILHDYSKLDIYGSKEKGINLKTQDKGHTNQLIEFADAIRSGIWPIPWWQQAQVCKIGFTIEEQLNS